ncbi:hypothetical protein MXB_1742 [Myxobolus squamalis]|nr:hypothetical protein MXB_1742 [Myxobolus squamalis]
MTENISTTHEEIENRIEENSNKMITELVLCCTKLRIKITMKRHLTLHTKYSLNYPQMIHLSILTTACVIDCLIQDKIFILEHALKMSKNDDFNLSFFYDSVQMKYSAVARSYLTIIVGCLIISRDTTMFKVISEDLSYSCNSVQSPIKGLYIRKFLVKSVLATGVMDEIYLHPLIAAFLTLNFGLMNQMWVRLAHHAADGFYSTYADLHDRLKLFIHFCLNRLSDLVEIDPKLYESKILPALLDEIILCANKQSQEILMMLILKTFDEELNISLANLLFKKISRMCTDFDYLKFVSEFLALTQRYIYTVPQGEAEPTAFVKSIYAKICGLCSRTKNVMAGKEALDIYSSYFKFASNFLPSDIDHMNEVVLKCYDLVVSCEIGSIYSKLNTLLINFCLCDLSVNIILRIDKFFNLLNFLETEDQVFVVILLSEKVCQDNTSIRDKLEMDNLMKLIKIMLRINNPSSTEHARNDAHPGATQQCFDGFCSFILALEPQNVEQLFYCIENVSMCAKLAGGECQLSTFSTLVNTVLHNIRIFSPSCNDDCEPFIRLFHTCFEIISSVPKTFPYLLIQQYLVCALYADSLNSIEFCPITIAFIREAFTLFEEHITSPDQLKCLNTIISCLYQIINIEKEIFYQFCSQAEKSACTFTSYTNQCYGILCVAHLHWLGNRKFENKKLIPNDFIDSIINSAHQEDANLKFKHEHQLIRDEFSRAKQYYIQAKSSLQKGSKNIIEASFNHILPQIS